MFYMIVFVCLFDLPISILYPWWAILLTAQTVATVGVPNKVATGECTQVRQIK